MKELSSLIRRVACSPSTYLYWAIAAVGTTCAHFNTGLHGSPILGAVSIATTLICLGLFYFHLNQLRNELHLPGQRSALGLFLSIFTFRLRLLLVFSPLLGLLVWQGTFGRLASEYLAVAIAPPERRFSELIATLSHFGLLLAAATAFILLDTAGRSQVVAQGNAKASIRRLPAALRKIAGPLSALVAARLALTFIWEYFSFLDYVKLSEKITLALALSWALEPLLYGLQIISMLYLAMRLKDQAPSA